LLNKNIIKKRSRKSASFSVNKYKEITNKPCACLPYEQSNYNILEQKSQVKNKKIKFKTEKNRPYWA